MVPVQLCCVYASNDVCTRTYLLPKALFTNLSRSHDDWYTWQLIVKFLPFMIGWFSLNLPSGLGLYYFANTVLTTAQQIYLRKLGGVRPGKSPRACPAVHMPCTLPCST